MPRTYSIAPRRTRNSELLPFSRCLYLHKKDGSRYPSYRTGQWEAWGAWATMGVRSGYSISGEWESNRGRRCVGNQRKTEKDSIAIMTVVVSTPGSSFRLPFRLLSRCVCRPHRRQDSPQSRRVAPLRLLLQAGVLVRVVNRILPEDDHSFVDFAIYITKQLIAELYFVYQPNGKMDEAVGVPNFLVADHSS